MPVLIEFLLAPQGLPLVLVGFGIGFLPLLNPLMVEEFQGHPKHLAVSSKGIRLSSGSRITKRHLEIIRTVGTLPHLKPHRNTLDYKPVAPYHKNHVPHVSALRACLRN